MLIKKVFLGKKNNIINISTIIYST